jgi:CubicO group peptidase (beta-lactamase class C family)
MNTGPRLEEAVLKEAVREAQYRTGVPGVVAGIWQDGATAFAAEGRLALGRDEPVHEDTPFRIASITKSFTATLAGRCLPFDEPLCRLLSHTAGLHCESAEPLPPAADGLFSYSNAGYWSAGAACAEACDMPFEEAMRSRVLKPSGLEATGFDEPLRPARGHVQEGESGQRVVDEDSYPAARRASGGLWSTASDLLRFAASHLAEPGALHEPRVEALGAHYALGWWVRTLEDGRTTLDHEGSVAGYQSLLLLVPEDAFALAVLTNSWRGSGLIRRVVESLGLAPHALTPAVLPDRIDGTYALDDVEATVEASVNGLIVTTREPDPVTGTFTSTSFPARSLGGGVFGFARGVLMSHRLDFPRAGFARIGWVVLPRVES